MISYLETGAVRCCRRRKAQPQITRCRPARLEKVGRKVIMPITYLETGPQILQRCGICVRPADRNHDRRRDPLLLKGVWLRRSRCRIRGHEVVAVRGPRTMHSPLGGCCNGCAHGQFLVARWLRHGCRRLHDGCGWLRVLQKRWLQRVKKCAPATIEKGPFYWVFDGPQAPATMRFYWVSGVPLRAARTSPLRRRRGLRRRAPAGIC